MSKFKNIDCPYCNSNVEVDIDFAKKNGRIFCGGCCKSFEIKIEDDKDDKNFGDYWD